MKLEMKIEKNVPLPTRRDRVANVVSKMKVGNSVLVKTSIQANNVTFMLRKQKFQGTRRKVKNGYRVWRIK